MTIGRAPSPNARRGFAGLLDDRETAGPEARASPPGPAGASSDRRGSALGRAASRNPPSVSMPRSAKSLPNASLFISFFVTSANRSVFRGAMSGTGASFCSFFFAPPLPSSSDPRGAPKKSSTAPKLVSHCSAELRVRSARATGAASAPPASSRPRFAPTAAGSSTKPSAGTVMSMFALVSVLPVM